MRPPRTGADRGGRSRDKRQDDDITFLVAIRRATREELRQLLWTHQHAPEWKVVALQRALRRTYDETR